MANRSMKYCVQLDIGHVSSVNLFFIMLGGRVGRAVVLDGRWCGMDGGVRRLC